MDFVESTEHISERILDKFYQLSIFLEDREFAFRPGVDWPLEADSACTWYNVVLARAELHVHEGLSLLGQHGVVDELEHTKTILLEDRDSDRHQGSPLDNSLNSDVFLV